ncbi:MAG: hypothetical protein HFG20_00710 [Anaerotruncus sp.]|jgi:hypothetical protein|nr:hypothetical protein [Anaerotruncus sp.]
MNHSNRNRIRRIFGLPELVPSPQKPPNDDLAPLLLALAAGGLFLLPKPIFMFSWLLPILGLLFAAPALLILWYDAFVLAAVSLLLCITNLRQRLVQNQALLFLAVVLDLLVLFLIGFPLLWLMLSLFLYEISPFFTLPFFDLGIFDELFEWFFSAPI